MIRNTFIFLGTFLLGAVIVLAIRAASFEPHAAASAPASAASSAAMVSNPLTPPPPAIPTATVAAGAKPVNTVCAICGMDVDPKLPTLEYQGKAIGFGCKLCPPKFQAEPDRYGPYYLRNEVIKR